MEQHGVVSAEERHIIRVREEAGHRSRVVIAIKKKIINSTSLEKHVDIFYARRRT